MKAKVGVYSNGKGKIILDTRNTGVGSVKKL